MDDPTLSPGRRGETDEGASPRQEGAPYPPHLMIESPYKPGVKRVKTDRFYKQEYHDLEVEKLWKTAWSWC